jgi:hypothetical protein
MSRPYLRILGALSWVAVAACGYTAIDSADGDGADAPAVSLAHYLAGPAPKISAIDPVARLQVHDPIFIRDADGSWTQVGYVESSSSEPDGEAVLLWHSRSVAPQQCRLFQYENRGTLEDVVATMLPPDMKLKMRQRMESAISDHGAELSTAFMPLVETSLRQSLPIIETQLREVVANHRADIDRLGKRWNTELIDKRLIPLAREEIIPIVRKHGEPTAERIGRELWDRASLWRFGWRAVYDKSPLPRRDLLEQEWDRFVEREAIPIFERHMDNIVLTVQRIFTDAAANEAVRSELAEVVNLVASDPETRDLVRVILKETLVENERLKEVWNDVWSSDEARHAFDLAGERFEPIAREIGYDLLGTEEGGINPNFARILREQILGKDLRWIVAERLEQPDLASTKTIEVRYDKMPYPIVHMAAVDVAGGIPE